LFPTILVGLTMLAFSFVGDGLQDALNPNRGR
jgi:ABC-type dipeptide/oligopeptide/nickel transport system permease subunit